MFFSSMQQQAKDGNVIINVITKKFTYENEIVEISIIVNGVTLNTIDNVVGYFSSVVFDTNSSLAIINYRGRMWSNFMLLDINTGQVIYYEPFCFADVIPLYQNKNMMNYEININDVMVFSCDKILDRDSIIFSYQVHDTNGYLQSGTFKYIISSQTFLDLQENEPEQEGQM